MNSVSDTLVKQGWEFFNNPEEYIVHFVEDEEANKFLNDLDNYPHAYVLACCMDRQIKAERAWMIPIRVRDELGDFSIKTLKAIPKEEYIKMFNENSFHRFNDTMADTFYHAVHHIADTYGGDASMIWKGNPSSAAVVYRFMQFKGAGIKIATMATNILARQFKIPFSDYYSIDVSPDVHVKRVMIRAGLISRDADNDMIIYKAREMSPDFPGIIDYPLWLIGRNWCHPGKPDCKQCIINGHCEKAL